jgi:putative membrane-bound dehydrogenase-like protein
MMRLSFSMFTGTALLLASLTSSAWAQKSPEEQLSLMQVPDGFEVQLFAHEPMVRNPSAIDVDTQGRVWVAEIQWYRRNAKDPPADTIKVLEDTDGDGKADKVTTFAEGVFSPMSVCVAGDKVYVATSPDMWVYEDKDGDLKADGPPTKLLTGFGGRNHDHSAHSVVFGPDHKWYMAHGDAGFKVTGTDGSKIESRWGAMIRGEADGSQLERLAHNFRNPYELAVSSFGDIYCSDNDNDGNRSCRVCWILEGGDYGWFGGPPFVLNQLDARLGPDVPYREGFHFRAYIPGNVPGTIVTGFGSPCGMAFYEGNAFGPSYKNAPWHAEAGPREVRIYRHEPLGYGKRGETENVVTAPQDNHFRPDDVCAAPDGSLYISDWYDRGVGGHAYDGPTTGRIFRLVPKDKTLKRIGEPGPYKTVDAAIVALGNPNLATQFLAREKLLAAGQEAVPALKKLKSADDPNFWARALWVLDRIGGAARQVVVDELKTENDRYRALAVRILRQHGDAYADSILAMADDTSAEVRREVLILAGQLPSEKALAAVIGLAARYDGTDRYELEAINIAANGPAPGMAEGNQNAGTKRAALYDALAKQEAFHVSNIALLQLLKPEAAAEVLIGALNKPNLSADDAGKLMAAISRLEDASAGKALARFVGNKSASLAMRAEALATLVGQLELSWSSLKNDPALREAFSAALAEPSLQTQALDLIVEQKLNNLAGLASQVAKSDAAAAARVKAMSVLSTLQPDGASETLRGLLSDSAEPVRSAALDGLIALRDVRTIREAFGAAGTNPEVKARIVERLMNDSSGALIVLRLVDEDRLQGDLRGQAVSLAIKHPDTSVRTLFDRFIPESMRPRSLGAEIKPDAVLSLTGNADRGHAIFFRSSVAQCGNCHVVGKEGKNVGPDLSQIGRKYDAATMLQHLLEPSKAVGVDYQGYVLETEDGKVHAGFLLSPPDGDLVMRNIQGEVIRIAKADVYELMKQEKSLMPELLLKDMTAQDAADLLSYLVSLREETVPVQRFAVMGPFGPGLDKAYGPEQNPGELSADAEYTGHRNRKVKWEAIGAEQIGGFYQVDTVKYDASKGIDGEGVVHYFRVTADSPSEQQAKLLLGSDDGVKVWLNGKLVHRNAASRAVGYAQDTVPVTLASGKNDILIKVENGSGPGGVSLAISAAEPLKLGVE